MSLIVDKWITVAEWQSDVDTNIMLKNGDWLDIQAQGSIWAGVWFTGENGPRGWVGWSAGSNSPLPGSPPFSLIGRTSEDGYFYIGDGLRRTYLNETLGPGETRLWLRINDDRPGNGSGAFNVRILVWRNATVTMSVTALQKDERILFGGEVNVERPVSGRIRREGEFKRKS
jgi:hypothetical protein